MGNCWRDFKDQFKPSKIGLDHARPEVFVTSTFHGDHNCWKYFYLSWRIVWAIFWLVVIFIQGILTYSVNDYKQIYENYNTLHFFIYFTNLSLLLLTVDCVVQASVVIYAASKYHQTRNYERIFPRMTWYLQMQWVLFNLSLASGIMTSIGFISFVIPAMNDPDPDQPVEAEPYVFIYIITHFVNTSYLIANLFISGMTVRIYHVYQPVLLAAAYLTFTYVFYAAGGLDPWGNPFIYTAFDWRDPTAAGLNCMYMVFGIIAIWFLSYGLCKAKLGCTQETGCCRRDRSAKRVYGGDQRMQVQNATMFLHPAIDYQVNNYPYLANVPYTAEIQNDPAIDMIIAQNGYYY